MPGREGDLFMNKKISSNAWAEMLKANDWDAVENWWHDWFNTQAQSADGLAPLGALLTALREVVPLVAVENGMERFERHIRPTDDENEWQGHEHLKGAAAILYLGELEAACEGEPPLASKSWAQHRGVVTERLEIYLNSSEVTTGADELSRKEHAQQALNCLTNIDMIVKAACFEAADEVEQRWITEVVAEIAYTAFEAGRHTQEAWGKSFEQFALKGEDLSRGGRVGGDMRRAQTSPKTKQVLSSMQGYRDDGHSVSHAASLTYKKGIGSSPTANSKLWHRHHK